MKGGVLNKTEEEEEEARESVCVCVSVWRLSKQDVSRGSL